METEQITDTQEELKGLINAAVEAVNRITDAHWVTPVALLTVQATGDGLSFYLNSPLSQFVDLGDQLADMDVPDEAAAELPVAAGCMLQLARGLHGYAQKYKEASEKIAAYVASREQKLEGTPEASPIIITG